MSGEPEIFSPFLATCDAADRPVPWVPGHVLILVLLRSLSRFSLTAPFPPRADVPEARPSASCSPSEHPSDAVASVVYLTVRTVTSAPIILAASDRWQDEGPAVRGEALLGQMRSKVAGPSGAFLCALDEPS